MRKKHLLVALVAFVAVALQCAAGFGRAWTDKQGRKLEASFVRVVGDQVVLERGNKPLVVPLSVLSDADVRYIREELTKRGQAGLLPEGLGGSTSQADAPAAGTPDAGSTGAAPPATASAGAAPSAPAPASPPAGTASDGQASDAPAGEYPERVWTDLRGNRVTARLVRVEGSNVILNKDGQERSFPLRGFSAADRMYVSMNARNPGPDGPPALASSAPAVPRPRLPSTPSMPSMPQHQFPSARTTPSIPRPELPSSRISPSTRNETPSSSGSRFPRREFPSGPGPVTRPSARDLAEDSSSATRSYEPPGAVRPPIRTPTFPVRQPPPAVDSGAEEEYAYTCGNCNRPLKEAKVGGKCPYCGTVWEREVDEEGNVVARSSAAWFELIAGVAVVVVLLGLRLAWVFGRS